MPKPTLSIVDPGGPTVLTVPVFRKKSVTVVNTGDRPIVYGDGVAESGVIHPGETRVFGKTLEPELKSATTSPDGATRRMHER